jgi:hypothetical protein
LLHREPRSLDVDAEKLVEMLLSDLSQGSKFSNAGVGENDIKFPLCLDGLIKAIQVGQFGNISLNDCSVGSDCLHSLVEFFLAAAHDEDVGALFHEELCCTNPIPVVPPVITATFPCSFLVSVIGRFLAVPYSLGVSSQPRRHPARILQTKSVCCSAAKAALGNEDSCVEGFVHLDVQGRARRRNTHLRQRLLHPVIGKLLIPQIRFANAARNRRGSFRHL